MNYQPDQEAIRKRAYELWEMRGRASGREADDWVEAERQLIASRASATNPDPEPAKAVPAAGTSAPAAATAAPDGAAPVSSEQPTQPTRPRTSTAAKRVGMAKR